MASLSRRCASRAGVESIGLQFVCSGLRWMGVMRFAESEPDGNDSSHGHFMLRGMSEPSEGLSPNDRDWVMPTLRLCRPRYIDIKDLAAFMTSLPRILGIVHAIPVVPRTAKLVPRPTDMAIGAY